MRRYRERWAPLPWPRADGFSADAIRHELHIVTSPQSSLDPRLTQHQNMPDISLAESRALAKRFPRERPFGSFHFGARS